MYAPISPLRFELALSREFYPKQETVLRQTVITEYYPSVKKRVGKRQKAMTDFFPVALKNVLVNFGSVPGVSKLVKNTTRLLVESLIDVILFSF